LNARITISIFPFIPAPGSAIPPLAVKDYGQRGFIQFVSPYITSSPAHSVVMSDLAVLHRAEECGCGVNNGLV
jgi:hypothetical protein